MSSLDSARQRHAEAQLDRLVLDTDTAPRGGSQAVVNGAEGFQQIGNWVAAGHLSRERVGSALQGIRRKDRRMSAQGCVRQGVRNGARNPYLTDDDYRAAMSGQSLPPQRSTPVRVIREFQDPAPRRPDGEELLELLYVCDHASAEPAVASWLRCRGIPPAAVPIDDTPLFALPVDAPCSWSWSSYRGLPWTATGHRLLIPLWDPKGWPRSLIARRVEGPHGPKSLAAKDAQRTGLVLANREAVGAMKDDLPTSCLLIVEGGPDWLMFCAARPDMAVVGVFTGAWRGAFITQIDPQDVIIATDSNAAGDRLAEKIGATFPRARRARVDTLLRRRGLPVPEKCPDWNDCLQDGVFTLDTAWEALLEGLELAA